ncbi:DNA-binding Lrp family transcriptional regulator [Rhodobacter aestuarii]|uniref:DNA-binding transcriptional regulator, Lrp family n=1 Tax=Rhodobacter aestuarii TaxID=453582 RepID=A0A1N7K8T1_9RHOB|nr:Lrp/AsnC family transcriptional regulator [Rhodobacter aestuarii]PTV95809.1 DNA-binding Lrp family transcriptional regulator [Rhodobacter aestuarii]SIS57967.1 DNA-binding transcriptional regulator, Lrp family [Rhodobacter aestuarii]
MWGEAPHGPERLDTTDQRLIAALRRDGRAAVSDLAGHLGLSRATVRARIERLMNRGEISGFTVITRTDVATAPVRGLMMLAIDGRQTEKIVTRLLGLPPVQAVHTTNGQWDLIAEIGARSLAELDETLLQIRRLEGVSRTETNLQLSSRRPAARF